MRPGKKFALWRKFILLLVCGWCAIVFWSGLSAVHPPAARAQFDAFQGQILAQTDLLERVTEPVDEATEPSPPLLENPFPNGNRVVLGEQTLFSIESAAGALSQEERAHEISENIRKFANDRSLPLDVLQVKDFPDGQSVDIRANGTPLMSVYKADAEALGDDQIVLANLYLEKIEEGVTLHRAIYSPRSMLIGLGKAIAATLIFGALIRGLNTLYRYGRLWFEVNASDRIRTIRIGSREIVQADQIRKSILVAVRFVRIFLFLILGSLFLKAVLSFFPQTRAASQEIFSPITTAILQILQSIIAYIPKLIFLIILSIVTFYVLKLIQFLFEEIEKGEFSIPGFDQDWAIPTSRIAQILTIALAAVIAFPYLPGANSGAFQGISIFLGILISLGSSSAISNLIAGILLTYTRAFRIGDMVEIGGVTGTVVEKGILVIRLLTQTNYYVSIPNSEVLSSHVTNFRIGGRKSNEADPPPMVVMTFGFAYEVPWQKIYEILLQAAQTCRWVLEKPEPMVLHQQLGNFCLIYELSMYTDAPEDEPFLKSHVLQYVQDICNTEGIDLVVPEFVVERGLSKPAINREAFSATDTEDSSRKGIAAAKFYGSNQLS